MEHSTHRCGIRETLSEQILEAPGGAAGGRGAQKMFGVQVSTELRVAL